MICIVLKQPAILDNSMSAREFQKECKAVLTSFYAKSWRAVGLAVDLVFSGIVPISDEIVMIKGKGWGGWGGGAVTAFVKLNVFLCCFII